VGASAAACWVEVGLTHPAAAAVAAAAAADDDVGFAVSLGG